jgi:hypothetical protein
MKKELLGYKAPDTEAPMFNNWRRVLTSHHIGTTWEYHVNTAWWGFDYQTYSEYHDPNLLKAERRQSRIAEVLAD